MSVPVDLRLSKRLKASTYGHSHRDIEELLFLINPAPLISAHRLIVPG